MNATDHQLELAVESCERWVLVGGAVLLIGLFADIVLAVAHPSYDSYCERWGGVLANIFVAIGVGIEIMFGRMSVTRQGELTIRAKKLLAEAIKEAGTARTRATVAMVGTFLS